ncbi:MAG: hypothetical protein ACRDM7_01330 [Thermoleophilaceae bacterium]
MDATTAQRFGQREGARTAAAGYDAAEAATPAGAEMGDRVSRGTVAGVAAGLVFLVANMLWATKSDLPAVAPLIDISTIFNFDDVANPTTENMFIGLVTHLTLSASFGVAFALLVPLLRNMRMLAAGAVVFGVALYLVNFQILGRTAFPWFQEGPDQLFELVAHAGFGLLLVPFFLGRSFTAMRGPRATRASRA